mmetsp:Transcript_44388/g.96433  ORF Transcript_44388/g.96433 Transcript_44388/m.96433 type:complete len:478 (-) Transcript_44388:331-1764(-)
MQAQSDVNEALSKHGLEEISCLGRGSFGEALLVRSGDGSRRVCKTVDIGNVSAKESKSAVQEAWLLKTLRHPCIVRYQDSFVEGDWLCVVMDYCEGGDLAMRIAAAKNQEQAIPEMQILSWLTQTLLALKHIHSMHILHRDVKPANLFLTKGGSLKLGDFGIAKMLPNTMAWAKTRIGTPYYLSPEACEDRPYTLPSDMWAMGCVLYELCCLQVPFTSRGITGLVQKICCGTIPAIPPPWSPFLRTFCGELLSREPQARPTAEELLQRAEIQDVIRKMLQSKLAQAKQVRSTVSKAPEHAAPVAEVVGPYQEHAGKYKSEMLVEYRSASHGEWLPASVVEVNRNSSIMLNLKRGAWLSMHDQASCVRPRAPSLGALPSSARATGRSVCNLPPILSSNLPTLLADPAKKEHNCGPHIRGMSRYASCAKAVRLTEDLPTDFAGALARVPVRSKSRVLRKVTDPDADFAAIRARRAFAGA